MAQITVPLFEIDFSLFQVDQSYQTEKIQIRPNFINSMRSLSEPTPSFFYLFDWVDPIL